MGESIASSTKRSWLLCLVSCVFDLDAGQKVEQCFPEHALTHEEKQGISYGAFPESLTQASSARNGVSDSSYAFRIRRCSSTEGSETRTPAYLYCFVYARQRQDERVARGAEQRSIVVVSELPYTSVLRPVTNILGPALLATFHSTSSRIFHDSFHSWPPPVPGALSHIGVGPHRVIGRVPLDSCMPQSEVGLWPLHLRLTSAGPPTVVLPLCGAFSDVCLARTLHVHSKQLWSLWEVMLLGEPMMVFCGSPERASETVFALLAMISPLPYAPDYRPLLSIHDPQVHDVQDGVPHTAERPVPTVFGVTNPYFLRACARCPNVMTLMHAPASIAPATQSRTGGLAGISEPLPSERSSGSARTLQQVISRQRTFSNMPEILSGQVDGISLSRSLSCVGQDKQVIAKLKAASDSDTPAAWQAASNALRSHFFHLTVSFLMPFFDYWGRLCPWVSQQQALQVRASKQPPSPSKGLKVDDFVQYLVSYKLSDTLQVIAGGKRRVQQLYKAFIESPNFEAWAEYVLGGEV